MKVIVGSTALRRTPRHDAPLETQLLYGETFIVDREERGWVHGRAALDAYTGYILSETLSDKVPEPNRWVVALRTIVYTEANCKSTPLMWLSMNALVRVRKDVPETNGYTKCTVGWILTKHLMPIHERASDWVSKAEQFIGTPYFWGGRDANYGVDCSGLMQNALLAGGTKIPRNSAEQQKVGEPLVVNNGTLQNLQRGDLVFWEGHVGVMRDGAMLIHATETEDFLK